MEVGLNQIRAIIVHLKVPRIVRVIGSACPPEGVKACIDKATICIFSSSGRLGCKTCAIIRASIRRGPMLNTRFF